MTLLVSHSLTFVFCVDRKVQSSFMENEENISYLWLSRPAGRVAV